MPKKPLDHEDRLEQQYKRLGTRQPICVGCAESNPFCLELHHIAGRKYDGRLSIVCANCHKKLSAAQLGHIPPLPTPRRSDENHKMETFGRFLVGLAVLLTLIVAALKDFGAWLINESRTVAK
jgi:hypothetical protein